MSWISSSPTSRTPAATSASTEGWNKVVDTSGDDTFAPHVVQVHHLWVSIRVPGPLL
jgi:hypothetical protein